MSRVKKSMLQKTEQSNFSKAVAYAQSIIRDKNKKALYEKKIKKGTTVYHAAIKEFMDNVKRVRGWVEVNFINTWHNQGKVERRLEGRKLQLLQCLLLNNRQKLIKK